MNEPDFSGIEPLRVPEARRRLAAINEYLALPNPRTPDVLRLASSIDLSRQQFLRLVRVWRDHRNARLLVIRRSGVATRDYAVDPRAVEIAEEVIAQAGTAATLAKVAPEIEARCVSEGILPLARATINNHLRKARADARAVMDGPPRIVIGRMWFHLPIEGLPLSAMPTVLAAVLLPERLIIAHEISTDPERPPSINALINTVGSQAVPGAPARELMLNPDDRRMGIEALARVGVAKGPTPRRSVQREISKAFSGKLGPVAAIHQRGMARPATKKVLSRQDHAISEAEAIKVITDAIDAHNAAMLSEAPPFDIERPNTQAA